MWIAGGLEATTPGSNVVLEKKGGFGRGGAINGINLLFYHICKNDGQRSSNGLPRPIWGHGLSVVAGSWEAAGKWKGKPSMVGHEQTRSGEGRGGKGAL